MAKIREARILKRHLDAIEEKLQYLNEWKSEKSNAILGDVEVPAVEKPLFLEWEDKSGIYSVYKCGKNESLNKSFKLKFLIKKSAISKVCSLEDAIKHAEKEDYNGLEYNKNKRIAYFWNNLDEKMYEYCRENLNKSKNTSKNWNTYFRKNFKKNNN